MILINALGIRDSGGITVLDNLLKECIQNHSRKFLIVCSKNENIIDLIENYKDSYEISFRVFSYDSLLIRFLIENLYFRKLIKIHNVELVYNFSGTGQFFIKVPQIIKIHDLSFFSKKNQQLYFSKFSIGIQIKWLLKIFIKRQIVKSMIKQSRYLEIQSSHVLINLEEFVNVSDKDVFIKSDIKIKKNNFQSPRLIDFSKRINFYYIVGPHFEAVHKNFECFVNAMTDLQDKGFDFDITITLTRKQLNESKYWNKSLDTLTNFLGYSSRQEIIENFKNNTILISTSIIESLGLHVIEATQNGILFIAPREKYSLGVYGGDFLSYETLNHHALVKTIKYAKHLNSNKIAEIIKKNQNFLISNEKSKYQNINEIFKIIEKY